MNDNTFEFESDGERVKINVLREHPVVRGLSVKVWEQTTKSGKEVATRVVIFGTKGGWTDIVAMEGSGGSIKEFALELSAQLHKVVEVCNGEWAS